MAHQLDPQTLMIGRSIILDTETTGFSPRMGDRIVEIGAVEVLDGKTTGREYHSYLNPGRPSHPAALETHGLSDAFLAKQPAFCEILPGLIGFLKPTSQAAPVWCHNAAFDQRFLLAELARLDTRLENPFFCSLDLSGQSLEDLAEATGYDWKQDHKHSALADARALTHALLTELWPRARANERYRSMPVPCPCLSKVLPAELVKMIEPRTLPGPCHAPGE